MVPQRHQAALHASTTAAATAATALLFMLRLRARRARTAAAVEEEAEADGLVIGCEECSAAGPALFAKYGVFAVRDAVAPAALSAVQRAAAARLSAVLRYRAAHYAAGTAPDNGAWRELCCRDGDRFDVHFRMAEEPFAALGSGGSWCAAVHAILGADAKLLYTGQVVACGRDPAGIPSGGGDGGGGGGSDGSDDSIGSDEPEDQAWHMDGEHLNEERDLPCHVLTVFVPLVDLRAENGATEFSPGSHLNHAATDDECALGECIIECAAGSAILFDYRTLHRGTANRTTADRPILYFTYAKSWFEDPVNYRHANQHKSILDGLPAG